MTVIKMATVSKKNDRKPNVGPGQTVSQVDANENLGPRASPFGQALRTLALSCDEMSSPRSNLLLSRRKLSDVNR